ncbi:putative Lunapark family protein [Helianthus annuus]|nr:putative Lunapark family protein [Helianthus annuus]KAJ0856596.1 putative Lunapark family protein [Helianthus annuus]
MGEEKAAKEVVDGEKKRGFWSWLWNGDDFEKRLQYIYKEEATLVARINRRSSTWRSTARSLILVSVLLEWTVNHASYGGVDSQKTRGYMH